MLVAGMRLNDRFVLRGVIGTGGMSEVWRADDPVLGRPVAVKVLTAALTGDAMFRTAVFAEARAVARLTHPHVAQVHDYGETTLANGSVLPYLIMELVAGRSLADRLASGPLPWRQAATVTAQIASALAAAHRLGIVHRDIKPANVMLTPTGAKVLDFGIAARSGTDIGDGRLVGTPAYVAPERLRRAPDAPAGDVYALGALLYEALTGRPPLAVTDWQQAEDAHDSGAPIPAPDAPDLPRQVRRLCMACLDPDPAQRPSAERLALDLSTAAGETAPPGLAVHTTPTLVAPAVSGGESSGYAPGAARVPAARTAVEGYPAMRGYPATSVAGYPATSVAPERSVAPRSRFALVGVAAVIAVIALILVLHAVSTGGTPQAVASNTPPPVTTAPSTPPATPSSAPPTATDPNTIINELNAAIDNAVATGRIDNDAASSLRDRVNEISKSLGRGGGDGNDNGDGGGRGNKHLGSKVGDFQQQVGQLLADGKIDQQTAAQLTSIVQPLATASNTSN
jgi:serine/threonine-protein kinase